MGGDKGLMGGSPCSDSLLSLLYPEIAIAVQARFTSVLRFGPRSKMADNVNLSVIGCI